jgi:putative sterol carrier protein/putative NADPH-quinone reductase
MKVLALNGSPRMKASSTYHMLKPLLDGMETAGAETEILHIRKLDLEVCIGCYTCWVRTPGECIHKNKDSMVAAMDQYNSADLVIFGTPLYHFSMSGIMKTFIDRTLPRIEPWLIPHPDIPNVTFHPERFHKPNKIMLVSPCGFPEFDHFESLVATFRHMARMERLEYLGEILRPGAEALSRRSLQGLFTSYYDIIHQAGEQIIRDGQISEGTQVDLRKDLFPGGKQAFYDMAGAYWTQQMDRFNVPNEKRHTVPILAADLDSVPYVPGGTDVTSGVLQIGGRFYVPNEHMLNYLAGMYNPKAIPDLRATIQFTFAPSRGVDFNPGPTEWYMNINDGECSVHEGRTALPTLAITTPHEIWQDIGMGLLDAEAAFDEGKFDVTGSMTLLEQFPQIFEYPQPGGGGRVNPELDMVMMGMPKAFNAKAAGDLDATIQFVLGGEGGGMYHLRIQDGECTSHHEPAINADLTINAPTEIWLAISKGEIDGQQAFMEAKYRATGDMNILQKMGEMFRSTIMPPSPVSQSPPAKTPPSHEEKSPDMNQLNCRDTIAGMPTVFSAKAAGDLAADIQFDVSGEEPGSYYLNIHKGTCTFHEGETESPSLTIHTPSEIWLAISRDEVDGQIAFMQQKYTVDGDFNLLMKLNQLFK